MENKLYYGDNLDILKRDIPSDSVDLIYLDPPFKSNADYNVLFEEKDGSKAASQIRAFTDTWTWTQEDEAVYTALVEAGGRVSEVMRAFRAFLRSCDMMAYLVMMAPRLMELQRVLKPTGSIYLHCDPTASHYLKILMDAVFGPGNFRREIVWRSGWVSGFKSAAKNWIRNHDIILYYLCDRKQESTFKLPFVPHPEGYKRRGGGENPKGVPLDDVWTDIYSPQIMSFSKEKLGYPTQKPVALLERIINASSNPGDLVLDPFCGCGTTVVAAQKLKRRWIGIDITHLAVGLMKHRLRDTFGDAIIKTFRTVGEPTSLPDAATLAAEAPDQFQNWALGLVGARSTSSAGKGADKGIDGKIIFQDEIGKFETVILSVKAGHTGAPHVRDLKGVLDREKAVIGVLISMQDPTKPMRTEATEAGFYKSVNWGDFPKIQLLTVAELLTGKQIAMPPRQHLDATFKKAARHKEAREEQLLLGDSPGEGNA